MPLVKRWLVADNNQIEIGTLEALTSCFLKQRRVSENEAETFFQPLYRRDIHNPNRLVNMAKAVSRIFQAIKRREQILVWGDYDADGVCSTAILLTALKKIGARAVPFIPHRHDGGYGLHRPTLEQLQSQFNLLITVDCGISNKAEVSYLNQAQKDVIIVDHHAWPSVTPAAYAIIHPAHPDGNYPFPYLCGAGVAWKLAVALFYHAKSTVDEKDNEAINLLDLVCLGTIGDVVPLLGENRSLVKFGLQVLASGRRPASKALLPMWSRSGLTARTISYQIAPLLNAAGRMDHAQPALDLLLSSNLNEAERHLHTLKDLNNRRRTASDQVQKAVEIQVGNSAEPILIAADAGWPSGVVGLVAGRLCEKYKRPAFVIGGAGEFASGSARAAGNVNVIEMITACKSHLIKYGGHAHAAGFSLEIARLKEFKAALLCTAESIPKTEESPPIHAEALMSQALLNWDLIDLLHNLEPFGEGNKEPRFIIRDMYLGDLRFVGKNQEHAKFSFRSADNDVLSGIGFGLAGQIRSARLTAGGTVDILGTLTVNEYRDRRSLQLHVKDVARTGEVDIQYEKDQ